MSKHRMSYISDLEHWRIEAKEATLDYVEEIHVVSDSTRGIRPQRTTQKWEVLRILRRGGGGEVRLERHGDKQRALKRIWTTPETLNDADYERELKALLEFSKPKYREAACFVEFYGWFAYGREILLAMEYIPLGDLDDVIGENKVSEAEAKEIALQILTGLNIMHLESFTHRDLKPGNVLVVHGRPDWWVKLADFGLSKRLTGSTVLDTRAGTLSYMAPEVRLPWIMSSSSSTIEYTNLVDLWALGCILYRLVTGAIPFPRERVLEDYCQDRMPFPEKGLSCLNSLGVHFAKQLLQANPGRRISSSEALKHPWITGNGDRRSSIVDRYAPSAQNESGEVDSRNILQPALQQSSSLQSILETFEFSEHYNSVSHAGLKSVDFSSQSDLSQPDLSATVLPRLESRIEETKNTYSGSQESVSEGKERTKKHFLQENSVGENEYLRITPKELKEDSTMDKLQQENILQEIEVKRQDESVTQSSASLLTEDASTEAWKGGAPTYAYSRYRLGASSSTTPSIGVTMIAASDYTAPPNYSSGLSFTKGTILYDVTPAGIEPGWVNGRLSFDGKIGLFPEKYLGRAFPGSSAREILREEARLRDIEINVQRQINEKRQELLARESQLREIEARMLREQESKSPEIC